MGQLRFVRALLVAVVIALAVLPAGALGAKPERFHEVVVESFEDEELCGITVDVDVMGVFTDQLFFDQEGNILRFMSTSSFRATFTDAEGDSVTIQNAGQFQEVEPIIDEEAGTITFVITFKGLAEKIRTAQGPVLLRDAGVITFADTFDLETGDFISSEVLVNKGPHPEADSDFTLFCEVITEALA
jgi:hypothetical protein